MKEVSEALSLIEEYLEDTDSHVNNLPDMRVARAYNILATMNGEAIIDVSPMSEPKPTITLKQLKSMVVTNDVNLPTLIVIDGIRNRWVGTGWVNEGEPRGDETVVVV